MKEIFFDLSTVDTGYAVFENEKYLYSGHINLPSKTHSDSIKRVYEMLCSINELVLIHEPKTIYGEKATFGSQTGQEIISYLHGGFRLLAVSNAVDCDCSSTPTHWRKVLGFDQSKAEKYESSRRAKQQSLQRAKAFTQKEIANDNEADAICLGIAHYIENEKEPSPKL